MARRTGLWIIGASGGVATTVIVGAIALRRGLTSTTGLTTELEPFRELPWIGFDDLVIGGHDVRRETVRESAAQIDRETRTFGHALLQAIDEDLAAVESNLRPGITYRGGAAIEGLAESSNVCHDTREGLAQIEADLAEFRSTHALDHVVVVNLASTEPTPPSHPDQETAEGIDRLIAEGNSEFVISSTLYAVAAARSGCGYINFTPSPGALLPGVEAHFERANTPYCGSDGKTGETLVKSALAPLFKYRNLKVLSWQGYNMLGDRDGEILAHDENREAKVRSKDNLLHEFLGYPVHSKVAIDYVPSLHDLKTAWDFIHFEGFLDFRMSLQFTWQGCDSILAAPLVLDLTRFITLALERDEGGPQRQLSIFFKSPVHESNHDLHAQYHRLIHYAHDVQSQS